MDHHPREGGNVVEYRLFTTPESKDGQKCLQRLKEDCLLFCDGFADKYLWHNQRFALSVSRSADSQPCLFGKTDFGESVDDEWLIVYLLFEVTKKFPVTASISDNDGQFLLFPAAEHLPDWLTPENEENRIFVRGGYLHIVPLSNETDSQASGIEDIKMGLANVWSSVVKTKASKKIQNCIHEQFSQFPDSITSELSGPNRHHACCMLPLDVAHVLRLSPSLISPIVQAFCNRDRTDMRSIRSMKKFPPRNGTQVFERVRFTRTLYAQMESQKFATPKIFQSAGFNIQKRDKAWHSCELGVKVTCGLEILYQQGRKHSKSESDHPVPKQDNVDESNRHWQIYKQSLRKNGFFFDYLEGSKPYVEREQLAKAAFQSHHEHDEQLNDQQSSTHSSVCHEKLVDQLLELSRSKKDFQSFGNIPGDDNDAWLTVTGDELDALLKKYTPQSDLRHSSTEKDSDKMEDDEFVANSLVNSMQQFVENVSSHDGAEVPGQASYDSNSREHEQDVLGTGSSSDEASVAFNPDMFMDILNGFDFSQPISNLGQSTSSGTNSSSNSERKGHHNERKEAQLGHHQSDEEMEPEDSHENISSTKPQTFNSTTNSTEQKLTDEHQPKLQDFMDQMDIELSSSSKLQGDFERHEIHSNDDVTNSSSQLQAKSETPTHSADSEAINPINLNKNLVKNILESYSSQHGLPGPASALYGQFGIRIPDKVKEEEEEEQKDGTNTKNAFDLMGLD